jgi:hypothetical protein
MMVQQLPFLLSAYHESARVVYAYKAGYHCEEIQVSENDPGGGLSKLNGGNDGPIIQAILSGSASSAYALEDMQVVAMKLLKIYAAGACAQTKVAPQEDSAEGISLDIPGQDMQRLEKAANFLARNYGPAYDNVLTNTIRQVLGEVATESIWANIESLAKEILASPDKKVNRFRIEDTLAMCGLIEKPRPFSAGTGISVQEDKTPSKPVQQNADALESLHGVEPPNEDHELLDTLLKQFLRSLKPDITDPETLAGIQYLKSIFKELT